MRLDIEGKHMTLAPHLMGWIAERLEDLNTPDDDICEAGFDHGAGHPLLFLDDAKAPNCRKNNGFKDLGNYSEWPKVAGAVIKADQWASDGESSSHRGFLFLHDV